MWLQSLLIGGYSCALAAGARVIAALPVRAPRLRMLMMGERISPLRPDTECGAAGTVWVHAASLGECRVLMRIVTLLGARDPSQLFLLTAATPTGVAWLREHRPPAAAGVGFLPLDTLGVMAATLERFNVKRVWLIETELWPSMLWACRRRGVRVGVINARIELFFYRFCRLFPLVTRPMFALLDPVLAQSDEYARRFTELGAGVVHVTGNMKSHVVMERPRPEWWARARARMHLTDNDIVLTGGCIHPGEAAPLLQAVQGAARSGLRLKLIIVPRHLEATRQLVRELGGTALCTRTPSCDRPWEVCLVECYGVLNDLYAIADAAFVGGTFVDKGGHNLWEPLQYGIPVFFGPHYHEQQQSARRILDAGVGFCVRDAQECAKTMTGVLLERGGDFIRAQQRFAGELASQTVSVEPFLVPAA